MTKSILKSFNGIATLFILLLNFTFLNPLQAQEDQLSINVIPPSPEAAALGKYGDIPVSTYTGLPSIGVPLYTINSKDIQIPISLSYHASGIRVNEEASWVGLGWILNSGGAITRTVYGKDDFDPLHFYYFNTNLPDITSEPFAYFQNGCDIAFLDGSTLDLENYPIQGNRPYVNGDPYPEEDFQPDVYSFNFLNYSGKFILNRNRDAVLTSRQMIDIQVDSVANRWEVTTPDGYLYIFDRFETYQESSGGLETKTAWYLTQIISPLGNTVTFNYDNNLQTYSRPVGSIYERKFVPGPLSCQGLEDVKSPIVSKNYSNVILASIDFDNGRVTMDYDFNRVDLDGAQRLNKVQIYKKDGSGNLEVTPFKEFVLSHSYFSGVVDDDIGIINTDPDLLSKRLRLDAVTEIGGTETKAPYQFTYYEGSNFTDLPSKSSFARDHWGYYNNALINNTLVPSYNGPDGSIAGADRDPNPAYTAAFSLKQITYPTGGGTEFIYENHDFDPTLSSQNEVGQNLPPELTTVQHRFDVNGPGLVELPLDLSDLYMTPQGTSSVRILARFFCNDFNCSSVINPQQIYFRLYDPDNNPLPLTFERFDEVTHGQDLSSTFIFSFETDYNLTPGIYTWRGNIGPGEILTFNATYFWEVPVATTNLPIVNAGGLRIKEIVDHDGANPINDKVRKFEYHYKEDQNNDGIEEEHSYGRRMSRPVYDYYQPDHEDIIQDGQLTVTQPCLSHFVATDSNVPLNGSASGSIVGYDQVTMLSGRNGEFGKTTSTYKNEPDLVLPYGFNGRRPGTPSLSFNRNGQLLSQVEYRYISEGNFEKVNEISHGYGKSATDQYYYGFIPNSPAFKSPSVARTNCDIDMYFYPIVWSEWHYLEQTTQKAYDQSDVSKFIETITQYFYEEPLHQQLTRQVTTDSQNKTIETKINYPLDYSAPGGVISQMNLQHIISTPIETTQWIDGALQSARANEFEYDAGLDRVLLKNIHLLETDQPITDFIPSVSGTTFDSRYQLRATNHLYDDRGNILEFSKEEDVSTTFIWGYNQTLPVAQIINASYAEAVAELAPGDLALLQGNTLTDVQVRAKIDLIRQALSDALVTCYTYDPLVGMTSQTDPRGKTIKYEYDDLNRLKLVRDHNHDIVQKYEYAYGSDAH